MRTSRPVARVPMKTLAAFKRTFRQPPPLTLACAWLVMVAACATEPPTPPARGAVPIRIVDDEYSPNIVRVPPGGNLIFSNRGRSPHNAIAADGSFSTGEESGKDRIPPGSRVVVRAFAHVGVVLFYCTFHGSPNGTGMAGIAVVGDAPPGAALATLGRRRAEPVSQPTGVVRRTPEEYPSIQAAVDASNPGDLVLVGAGIWRESVRVSTPSLTIRGVDRQRVVLDGEFRRANGVAVYEADGVALENLEARNFQLNGFYWTGVTGYRGTHLTAVNNVDYGIYAFDATDGVIAHSYASGSADAGVYIGQCNPCRSAVYDVVAENNAVGFSGVNAGGDLFVVGSIWRRNRTGIGLASLDSELHPPQASATIAGNLVGDNNNRTVAARPFNRLAQGIGIAMAGSVGNVVMHNQVVDHETAGIVLAPIPDAHLWLARANVVHDNDVHHSGLADIVLVAPSGGGNCFAGNTFDTSQPPGLQVLNRCGQRGYVPLGWDLASTSLLMARRAQRAPSFTFADVARGPAPPEQPQMPAAASAPARPALHAFADFADLNLQRPEQIFPPPLETPRPSFRKIAAAGLVASETSPWQLLFGIYGYFFPLALLSAWLSLAFWDIARREDRSKKAAVVWIAAILLVPFIGVVTYHAVAARFPGWFRVALVAGGFLAYLLVLVIGALLGGIA